MNDSNATNAISRNAAIEALNQHSYETSRDYDKTVELLNELPALDVAPVVHARWIPITLYGKEHAIKCSACNNCDNPSKVPGRYCWQCGARMDGDAE